MAQSEIRTHDHLCGFSEWTITVMSGALDHSASSTAMQCYAVVDILLKRTYSFTFLELKITNHVFKG